MQRSLAYSLHTLTVLPVAPAVSGVVAGLAEPGTRVAIDTFAEHYTDQVGPSQGLLEFFSSGFVRFNGRSTVPLEVCSRVLFDPGVGSTPRGCNVT
mmetsp:Transcript_2268/g.3177  ORF Transcript_2268/g.3177 Transcript_2268/m.3177 type:complete len:96 (-) Transcript_2268:172-459(-)